MKNYFSNRPAKTIETQLLSLQKLMVFLRKECNVWSCLMYGTLLGAIRNNNVIPHDTDYDITIHIPGNNIKEIHDNYNKLCLTLSQHKMLLKVWSQAEKGILNPTPQQWQNPRGQLHVATPDIKLAIDCWLSWQKRGKLFLHPFINGSFYPSDLVPYNYGYIRDINFVIPNNSIKFLEYIYGEDWKIPQNKKPKIKRYEQGIK